MYSSASIVTRGYDCDKSALEPWNLGRKRAMSHLRVLRGRGTRGSHPYATSSSWNPRSRPNLTRFPNPGQGTFQWTRPPHGILQAAKHKSLQELIVNLDKATRSLEQWKAAKAKREQQKTQDDDDDIEVLGEVVNEPKQCSMSPSRSAPSSHACPDPGLGAQQNPDGQRGQLEKSLQRADEQRKDAMESLLRKRAILSMKNNSKTIPAKATPAGRGHSSRFKVVRGPSTTTAHGSRYKFVRRLSESTSQSPLRRVGPSSEFFLSKDENEVYRLVGEKKLFRTRPETGQKRIVTQFKLTRVPSSVPAAVVSNVRCSASSLTSVSSTSVVKAKPAVYKRFGRYKLVKVHNNAGVSATKVIRSRFSLRRVPVSTPAGFKTVRSRFSLRRVPVSTPISKKISSRYSFVRTSAVLATRQRSERTQSVSSTAFNAQSVVSKYRFRNLRPGPVNASRYKWRATPYCAFFIRHGYCEKAGSCPFKHDPQKVTMCPVFLMDGHCEKPGCLLVHRSKWSEGQTQPVCVFLLRGKCDGFRAEGRRCVLLHPEEPRDRLAKREPCQEFVRTGYCPAGVKCPKLHVNLCQKFTVTGNCPDGDECPNLHKRKTVAGKNSFKTSTVRKTKTMTTFTLRKPDVNASTGKLSSAVGDVRYFSRGMLSDSASVSCQDVVAYRPERKTTGGGVFGSSFIPV